MKMDMITFNLFPEDVDTLDDPKVQEFLSLLENMASAYEAKLRTFAIRKGTVIFSVNNEEMCNDLLDDLEELTGRRPRMASDEEDFIEKFREEFDKPK